MDLQTMAQAALLRSGMRYEHDTISVTSEGIGLDFITAVQDAWRDLQRESKNWFFRQKVDQTLAITSGDDDYNMPSGLETINYRTVTIYTTAKTDETPLTFIPYEDWRVQYDTLTVGAARPTLITESYATTPVIQLWPVPDQNYTMRYDGVYDIDEMAANADTPGKVITAGTQTLPSRYHYVLVWDAVRRVALKNEDPQLYATADERYRAERARLSERLTGDVYVKPGMLTGAYGNRRRPW